MDINIKKYVYVAIFIIVLLVTALIFIVLAVTGKFPFSPKVIYIIPLAIIIEIILWIKIGHIEDFLIENQDKFKGIKEKWRKEREYKGFDIYEFARFKG